MANETPRKLIGRCIQCNTDYSPSARCRCGSNATLTGSRPHGHPLAKEFYKELERKRLRQEVQP